MGARSENQGGIGSSMLEAYGELGEILTCHEYFCTPVAERLALPHKDKDEQTSQFFSERALRTRGRGIILLRPCNPVNTLASTHGQRHLWGPVPQDAR